MVPSFSDLTVTHLFSARESSCGNHPTRPSGFADEWPAHHPFVRCQSVIVQSPSVMIPAGPRGFDGAGGTTDHCGRAQVSARGAPASGTRPYQAIGRFTSE